MPFLPSFLRIRSNTVPRGISSTTTLTPIALPICSFPFNVRLDIYPLPAASTQALVYHSLDWFLAAAVKSSSTVIGEGSLCFAGACLQLPNLIRPMPSLSLCPVPGHLSTAVQLFYTRERFKRCLYSLASSYFGLLKKLDCLWKKDIIKTLKQLKKIQNRTVKITLNHTTQDKARFNILMKILQISLSLQMFSHDLWQQVYLHKSTQTRVIGNIHALLSACQEIKI